MRATVTNSALIERRGRGRYPDVSIMLESDNEMEKAILRMAYAGKRSVYIYASGNAARKEESWVTCR
jgi:hypothetical protein